MAKFQSKSGKKFAYILLNPVVITAEINENSQLGWENCKNQN